MLSKLSQLEGVDLDKAELVGVPIEIASEAGKDRVRQKQAYDNNATLHI